MLTGHLLFHANKFQLAICYHFFLSSKRIEACDLMLTHFRAAFEAMSVVVFVFDNIHLVHYVLKPQIILQNVSLQHSKRST
jgi:hypothetical protein